jgi:uncharacterized protein YcbX
VFIGKGTPAPFDPPSSNMRRQFVLTAEDEPPSLELMRAQISLIAFVSAVFAIAVINSIVHAQTEKADTSKAVVVEKAGKAVPINEVQTLKTEMTSKLNAAIDHAPALAKEACDTHVARDVASKKCISVTNAKGADVIVLAGAELADLKRNIDAQLKTAVAKNLSVEEVANGQLGNEFFTTKIKSVGPKADVKAAEGK